MASTDISPQIQGRRHDLDWLRIIAFGLLIAYHIGMFYVSWDWHVKSAYASPAIEPVMRLVNPWRLPLLFFISGVALKFALDKAGRIALLRRRVPKLFLPLAFGFFVLVAPQAYYELLGKGEIAPGFLAFYGDYLDFDFEFTILTPTWNHLWYLAYMLVYTLLLVPMGPILLWFGRPFERLAAWAAAQRWAWPMLVLPALPLLTFEIVLEPYFPTTHAMVDDWYTHAGALFMVMLGWLAAKSQGFWRAVDNSRRASLGIALGLGVLMLLGGLGWLTLPGWAWAVLRAAYCWQAILALLGLAQRYLNRTGPVLAYLGEAVFAYYVLHQTLIVCLGVWFGRLHLPALAEASLIALGTVAGCGLLYELVIRRVTVLRPLFGLDWQERRRPATAPMLAMAAQAAD